MRPEAGAAVAVVVGAVGTAFLLPYLVVPFMAIAVPFTIADFECLDPLVVFDVRLSGPGGNAESFWLEEGCRLEFDLQVHELAGELRIWVTGPGGTVYQARVQGADTHASEAPTYVRTESAEPGLIPRGTYTYRYAVNGAAQFVFTGSAHRAV